MYIFKKPWFGNFFSEMATRTPHQIGMWKEDFLTEKKFVFGESRKISLFLTLKYLSSEWRFQKCSQILENYRKIVSLILLIHRFFFHCNGFNAKVFVIKNNWKKKFSSYFSVTKTLSSAFDQLSVYFQSKQ